MDWSEQNRFQSDAGICMLRYLYHGSLDTKDQNKPKKIEDIVERSADEYSKLYTITHIKSINDFGILFLHSLISAET
jgi:hypothetical protein